MRRFRIPAAFRLMAAGAVAVTLASAAGPAEARKMSGYEKERVMRLVIREAHHMGVSPALALAIAKVESDFQIRAKSHKGARGVMQIMPATARGEYGISPGLLWNPRINVRLGLHFLRRLIARYEGRVDLALSYYNGGSAVGTLPHARVIPATRKYVNKVQKYRQMFRRQLHREGSSLGYRFAGNLILEEGKSSELAQCLHVVQEATVDDDTKYTEKTCRELARHIVCRTYAPVIHELCHLVVIAAHGGGPAGRYEELFWDTGAARAANFRGHLEARPWTGTAVAPERGEAAIAYADKPFAVAYGRMPLLSALMEFLMTALGYTPLDEALDPLLGDLPTAGQVSDAANDLSRRLYAYLNDHLPPVQAQRKNRSFLSFAAEQADGALTPQSLSDGLVLDYWQAHAAGDGDDAAGEVDARTFKGVFETAARLVRVLRYAEEKYRMGGALPIGTDRDAGEVDPADFERAVGEIEEGDDPLADAEACLGGAVKFLNKRELTVLGEVVHGEPVTRVLPRSILRAAVFGHAQARLTQAQRGKPKPGELAAMIDALPDQDYDARIEDYWSLVDHMDRMLLAAFHVLAGAGHSAAISLALALRPDMNLGGIDVSGDAAAEDTNVVSFQAAQAGRQFFAAAAASDGSDLSVLGDDARVAFKAVSRKGFTERDLGQPGVIDAFSEGVDLLLAARDALVGFLEKPAAGIDWPVQFTEDKPVFNNQFMLLYGGQDG